MLNVVRFFFFSILANDDEGRSGLGRAPSSVYTNDVAACCPLPSICSEFLWSCLLDFYVSRNLLEPSTFDLILYSLVCEEKKLRTST